MINRNKNVKAIITFLYMQFELPSHDLILFKNARDIFNNNKKFRSFKSKENIHKKEFGPYRGFGYSSFISDPINLAKRAGG